MNIFFLSLVAREAARLMCDKHCVKMILETAQLLSTAIRLLCDEDEIPIGMWVKLYKTTHKNHPSAIWARESRDNFMWLLEHGLEMCQEYTRRYGRTHKTQAVLEAIEMHLDNCTMDFPQVGPTRKPICMPLQHRIKGPSLAHDVVDSYWLYYAEEKEYFAKWAHCEEPKRWRIEVGKKRKREETKRVLV